ncbi:hypothetical protein BOVATA_018630 [Babesia ovata]|uniref:Uncharacterized protein n=1 Tax=Babesia ovata TaxID=189622 RepID=A0A2H6KBJ8_9APIC|nr:uncharacterized protein BOVATA_018630 [Babesia ovata]GBE60370.1 hypothetical protein BOVATA_018630 [Babesia ovata]
MDGFAKEKRPTNLGRRVSTSGEQNRQQDTLREIQEYQRPLGGLALHDQSSRNDIPADRQLHGTSDLDSRPGNLPLGNGADGNPGAYDGTDQPQKRREELMMQTHALLNDILANYRLYNTSDLDTLPGNSLSGNDHYYNSGPFGLLGLLGLLGHTGRIAKISRGFAEFFRRTGYGPRN